MRMKRSVDVGSDHHLVVAEVKMKLLVLKKPIGQHEGNTVHTGSGTNRYDALYDGSDDEQQAELDVEHQ